MGDVLPFSNAPTPEDEAQQWIIRIDGAPLSNEERAALRDWLARDPRHGQLLDQHARLWHAAGKARAVGAAPGAARAGTARWTYGAGIAGLIAAGLAAVAVGVGPLRPPAAAAPVLQTAAGQHQRFTLSDGSRIELNTRSRAVVKYLPGQRQIVLEDGEGYFDVAKDKDRPFTVVAGTTTVRAVGTRFSVRRRAGGDVDVVVSEGVVQVAQRDGNAGLDAAPARVARLVAGQALAAKAAHFSVAPVTGEKMAQLLAWQKGRVAFDDTPLSAALEEMSRYAPQPVTPGDARAAAVKVSGSFATDNLEAFLKSLELGLGLKVRKGAGGYVVESAPRG